jgi:acyl-CoA synthetase (AMP-forming)/AMP-acid ligase II
MPGPLLKLLLSRARALTFLEWREVDLHEANPEPFTLETHGKYLLARSPSPQQLWSIFTQSLEAGDPLVILGPMTLEAETILLRQLPTEPPPGAVLVLFTSGSTGQTKAVFHLETSLLASGEQMATGLGAPTSQASLLPAWGMAGIAFHLLLPLFSGKRILWWKQNQPFHEMPAALHAAKINLLSLNPFLLEMLLRNESFGGKDLDVVSLTAPLRDSHRERFRKVCPGFLREIYGMTEAAGPVLLDGKSLGAAKKISEGELLLRGAQLSLGYAEEGKFLPAETWFATGDSFSLTDGFLRFVSRKKELIDVGGRKIPPQLIEEIFRDLPEIEDCLAFALELQGVERVALAYVRSSDCKLSIEALAQKISERSRMSLSLDMRPFEWRELENIPRLHNGKASRMKAKELFTAAKAGT